MLASTIPSPFDAVGPRAQVAPVVVHGRRWCAIGQMTRRQLDRLGVPYEYVDLDGHPEAESAWMTGGRAHTPIVSVGGRLPAQPGGRELARALERGGW